MSDNDQAPRRPWHDFAHTASVYMATALAEYERAQRATLGWQPAAYTFELLAAATEPDAPLPSSIDAREGGLRMTMEQQGDELWLRLELDGFAAIEEHAGRTGILISANRAISYPLVFDGAGRALCILDNTPEVRAGTRSLSIVFDLA